MLISLLKDIITLLEAEFGKDMVENGGLKVYTTIDLDFQQKVEGYVKDQAELRLVRLV